MGAITYVIGALFLKEAGVAMREIVWFFRKKDYIRCPLEVLCFLKVGESLFSNKCLSLPCGKETFFLMVSGSFFSCKYLAISSRRRARQRKLFGELF